VEEEQEKVRRMRRKRVFRGRCSFCSRHPHRRRGFTVEA
jgi:hypothetical protein